MKIAVIGIGQSLRGDDAAGLEAVRQWRTNFPETANKPGVRIEACELPGLALLDLLCEVDAAIIVDAIQSSAPSGVIHTLSENELSAFTSDTKSAHGWGIAETLQLGHELMGISTNIRIIGIPTEQVDMGTGLSNSVIESLPFACKAINQEIINLIG